LAGILTSMSMPALLASCESGDEGFENFHSENVSSNEGKARITYVNTGVLSGNATAEKISMDIFNGDKTLAFGGEKIRDEKYYGNFDWDGMSPVSWNN